MDYYDDYEDDDYDFYQPPESSFDQAESWRTCIEPSVSQTAVYIAALLGSNVVCHFIWCYCRRRCQRMRGEWLQHTASMLCGFGLLYFAIGHDFLIVLFLTLLAYVFMLALEYVKCTKLGPIVAAATITAHFTYELLWDKPEAWQRIRGIQMVATMKIVSLAFDMDAFILCEEQNKRDVANRTSSPALVPFLGYLFCPANCVLGPWFSFDAYHRTVRVTRARLSSLLLCCAFNALLAIGFLCLSNCFVPLLCTDHAWKWLRTYRDALSVRCSHYFICFLSQATLAAAGVEMNTSADHASRWLGHAVTKPLESELPRSLSTVVRSWNIPMHEWLKHYVFHPVHKRWPDHYLAAILSTYLVSALLHGLHVQIYAVLLSLGVFAYAEAVLRRKLATVFDACITAQPCRKPSCIFTHCPSHGWRRVGALAAALVNCCFGLVNVLHLAYLGIMMNTSNDADVGVNHQGHLRKWANLGYSSHWIALASYLFYLSI